MLLFLSLLLLLLSLFFFFSSLSGLAPGRATETPSTRDSYCFVERAPRKYRGKQVQIIFQGRTRRWWECNHPQIAGIASKLVFCGGRDARGNEWTGSEPLRWLHHEAKRRKWYLCLQLSFVKLAWQGMELQQAAPKARICINGRICVHPSVTMVVQSTKSQCWEAIRNGLYSIH